MQQEITPRHIIIAAVVLLVIIGFFAWRSFSRPGKANINFIHFGGGPTNPEKRTIEQGYQSWQASHPSANNPSSSAPGNH